MNYKLLIFTLVAIAIIACQEEKKDNPKRENIFEFSEAPEDLKINEIQVIGTHNSYAQEIDTNLMKIAGPMIDAMKEKYQEMMSPEQKKYNEEHHPNKVTMEEGLSYSHPDFKVQLDSGLRNLEIDVYYDPTGNRFNKPAGYQMLEKKGIKEYAPIDVEALSKPGFKVLHIADFDFRSHYPTLKDALTELKGWSEKNPDHVPIFIQLEAKDSAMPLFENSTEVLKYDSTAYAELDKEIIDILGRENLIMPDDVRGDYNSLEEAVLAKNWPLLKDSRGKFIFLMLPTTGGGIGETPYLKGTPNLEGRAMFIQSQPGQNHAAFVLKDNSLMREDEIKKLVEKGYLVRTRSDIETYEAKINDYKRAEAAFRSGAQIVSTDYFRPGNNYGTDYFVELPNGKKAARCNPINAKDKCKD